MSHATPASPSADRNLLFGILAVQMDFVSRDALVAAMHAWVLAKHRPLGDFLQEQGALSPERRALLDAMANEHLKAHGGDPQRSLSAVARPSTLGDVAASVADPELQASLAAAGATLATTADFRPSEDGLRYHILRPHAQGGLGVVSVARDAELGREVAFKEMQARYAEDAAQRGRFVREAEITGGLEHPGVVPVYGLGRHADGRPYYAMRFVRGESLQDALRKLHAGEAGYTLRGLLTRFVAVCNAVAYAHSRGVLHRDLKRANVMLGPYGETLVVDWGLAKVVGREPAADTSSELTLQPPSGEGSLTQAGAAMGTPAFMSPEQARGEIAELRPATDVYSLGATLYAVLTGRPPVQGRDTAEVLEKVRQGDWPPPRQVSASVPRALDAVCRKAMALRPADRYGTALELAADIERWLADEPVSAWREPWPTRAGRWVRRHRTKVAAAVAASFVALLLGGAGLLWQQRQQARQREELDRRVAAAEAALQRVSELQAAGRWAEAEVVLEQADERLGESGPPELRRRLETTRGDLELVSRLEGLRPKLGSRTPVGDSFDPRKTDRGYEAVFKEAGLGVPRDDPEATAHRVAASSVTEMLVAALDDWAAAAEGARRAWALEVARRADPDPWRHRLRDPAAWQDKEALAKLVREAPSQAVTPALAAAVGNRLQGTADGERLLRSALDLRPGDYWLNIKFSEILTASGRAAEAESYARAALVLRPDAWVSHNNLGFVLELDGRLAQAESCLRKAIDLDPKHAVTHGNLGTVLEGQGKLEEAAACARKAIELDPELAWAHANLGSVLERQGKLEEAAACARKAIELAPGFAVAHGNLGSVLDRQGKLEEAAACLRRAIELDPKLAMAHNGLGWVLGRQGKLEEAAACLRKAIELDPKNNEAHNYLIWVLDRQGKLEEAAAFYRKAIDQDPKNAMVHSSLGRVLINQGRLEEAAACLRKAIELDPKNAMAHSNLGRVLTKQGKLEEAAAFYRKAIDLDPASSAGYVNLGVTMCQWGRLNEAIALHRKAVEVSPRNATALADLADALMQQGKPEEAATYCRKVLELDPKDWLASANLAEVLMGLSRYAEAEEADRRALALMPSNDPNHLEVEAALRRARLGPRLAAVLRGDDRPASAAEGLDFATVCRYQWRLADAARLYADAYAADPKLAADLAAGHRHEAACCAALAGCGNGPGAPVPGDKEQARLLRQARTWLRADLAQCSPHLAGSPSEKAWASAQLQRWQVEDALAGVRDAAGLAALPMAERKEWEAFWAEVNALSNPPAK
jgi:tetratricopeptide (TPR) repeat protein